MDYKYSFQRFDANRMARAVGRSLPISIKHSVELANTIRGMNVQKAKKFLENVVALKQPVHYGRFNRDLGHKAKMGPGRYPKKTAVHFLELLKLAEANAGQKNLSAEDLVIVHIAANKAAARWHYGRQRRRQFKSTHVEFVVEEKAVEKKKRGQSPKAASPADKKAEPVKASPAKPAVKPAAEAKPAPAEKKPEPAKPATDTKPAPAEKKPEAKPAAEKAESQSPEPKKTETAPEAAKPEQKPAKEEAK